ncbi:MAG TPA: NAD-dependent epimerase/dehydratase family protein [Candidatus Angelobacter sp.]|nr:NAD-dependent epimerase/dehydratase family protein [Candidatus Angelobacter sp.]
MRVLVTGGGGFIGSHAAEYFASEHQVVICDNLSRASTLDHNPVNQTYNWDLMKKEYPKITLHQIDIRDFAAFREASKSAEVIIHTAGQVAVTSSLRDPRTDFEVNALGTFNTLEAARLNDAALVFCSTNKVYGENVNAIPVRSEAKRWCFDDVRYVNGIPETFSVDHTGHSPYGASKLSADIYVQDYAHTYGLKACVFRMSCIYGERQFGVEDQGWLAWFIIASLARKPITIYGDGKQVRDVLYVKDLILAFDHFVKSRIKHGVFNMGGGPENTLSLLELLDIIEESAAVSPQTKYQDWRPADQKVYISDIRKAREELAWKPTIRPLEGVKRVLSWALENKNLFS